MAEGDCKPRNAENQSASPWKGSTDLPDCIERRSRGGVSAKRGVEWVQEGGEEDRCACYIIWCIRRKGGVRDPQIGKSGKRRPNAQCSMLSFIKLEGNMQ